MDYNLKPILFRSIKEMPLDQRPREKLCKEGASSLSDIELLCSIIGRGVKGRPVQDIACDVLEVISNVKEDEMLPVELCKVEGLGDATAAQICASIELGRRLNKKPGRYMTSPSDIYDFIRHYGDRKQEHFLCIMLNGAKELLSINVVTVGLVNKTLVHPREVFSDAIKLRATGIIIAHNHPSGNLEPSEEDFMVTNSLKKAGRILGIELLDHIIFSGDNYYSMLENGLL